MNQVASLPYGIYHQLNFFDIFIIGFFVALFLLLPKWFDKKTKAVDYHNDYLLMGKSLTMPLFVATLTSTWYGGILGVTQIAYLNGVYSFFTQGLFWYVSYFFFAIFLAKKIRNKQVLSLPELLGKKFGIKARKLSAMILFFHALPVTYAISTGILLELILDIDFFWAMILGVSLVALYTGMGGFRGVVVTDCLQFLLMFLAVIMVAFTCFDKFGGLNYLKDTLPAHYFSWHGEGHIREALIWLFIACTSTFIHPVFYQRCLAAKSDNVAIFGIFIAMGFWLLFDFCTSIGGMFARAILPEANSETAYLELGMNMLPHGLRGLFLSGVLATILSTLDSFMFVSGTSLSYDFLNEQRQNRVSHPLAILFSAIVVMVVGFIFEKNFEATWLFMEGAFSTSMLIPVLASVLMKRRFSDGIFITTSLGTLVTFAMGTILFKQKFIVIEPFYLAHGMALILFCGSSYLYAQGEAKMANLSNG